MKASSVLFEKISLVEVENLQKFNSHLIIKYLDSFKEYAHTCIITEFCVVCQ
jgi:hypothetical protein